MSSSMALGFQLSCLGRFRLFTALRLWCHSVFQGEQRCEFRFRLITSGSCCRLLLSPSIRLNIGNFATFTLITFTFTFVLTFLAFPFALGVIGVLFIPRLLIPRLIVPRTLVVWIVWPRRRLTLSFVFTFGLTFAFPFVLFSFSLTLSKGIHIHGNGSWFCFFPGLDILEIGQNFSFHLVIRGQSRSLQVQMILQLVGTHSAASNSCRCHLQVVSFSCLRTFFSSSPNSQALLEAYQDCIDLDAKPFSTRLNWLEDFEDHICTTVVSWLLGQSGYHEMCSWQFPTLLPQSMIWGLV